MGPVRATMQNMLRTLGNRGFSNASLETEFQAAYRSYGTRFLFVSSMVAAIYFMVFFSFDLLTGHRPVTDQVQLGRLGLSCGLLLFGFATRLNKAFFARHYTAAFVSNMSHEIRTPKNGVIGALSMLNDEHLSERDRLFVKSARDSARNLMHLLNEILDYSKLDAHKIRLSPSSFDPLALISGVAHAFQGTAEQKGIGIRRDCHHVPADIRSLTGDEGKMRQVLLNLSVRKLGPEVARVTLDVSDTGVGIPPDAIDKLFQPFYQVESGSNRSYGGTGLGLAICKQIVDEMGGEITVRSVLGIGTTFEIALDMPYSTEALSEAERLQGSEGFADPQPPAMADLRLQGEVLLVEDNEVNAFIATMTLESLGVSCQHARNGEDALALFGQNAFDVVLMDCEMPVMDGYEAARRIRQMEAADTARERTPVIALTAHALSGDREVCLANGMDDYLTKPFDREALAVLLSRWLPVSEGASAQGS